MNYKLRLFIVDMIGIIQRFLVAYCIITVFLYQTDTSAPFHALGLIPIPFLSYFIERKTKHIWTYVLLHCAILPVYLIASYSMDSAIIFSIYILLTAAISYYTKNSPTGSNNYYLMIVFLLFYIGSVTTKMLDLSYMIFLLAILFTLLHFLNLYLNNFTKYLQAHASMTNIPYRQIKNSNNALVIFLGLLFLFVILIASGLQLNAILIKAAKAVLQFMYVLFSFFMRKDSDMEAALVPLNAEGLGPAKTSPLIQLIFKIIEWLLLIVVVIVVILLITWSIYKIYQYFYRRNKNEITDRVEFISPFTKKEASEKASSRLSMKRFGHSNNGAIRKYFYQAVSSSVEDCTGLQKDLTPTDLAGLVKSPNLSDSTETSADQRLLITGYYEKARYSSAECSKEEVKKMKQLLK